MLSKSVIAFCALLCVTVAHGASIDTNLVYETARIDSSEELVSSIISNCFDGETMTCLKGKVLTYLDTVLNLREESARSFASKNVDEVIYDRVARVLATNELKMKLLQQFTE